LMGRCIAARLLLRELIARESPAAATGMMVNCLIWKEL
jgi:hypothetical protein